MALSLQKLVRCSFSLKHSSTLRISSISSSIIARKNSTLSVWSNNKKNKVHRRSFSTNKEGEETEEEKNAVEGAKLEGESSAKTEEEKKKSSSPSTTTTSSSPSDATKKEGEEDLDDLDDEEGSDVIGETIRIMKRKVKAGDMTLDEYKLRKRQMMLDVRDKTKQMLDKEVMDGVSPFSILTNEASEEMYRLYRADPVTNSPDALSSKFSVSKLTVMASLKMKQMEKDEEIRTGRPSHADFEIALIRNLKQTWKEKFKEKIWNGLPEEQAQGRNPSYKMYDPEIDQDIVLKNFRYSRFPDPKKYLPEKTPQGIDPNPRILTPAKFSPEWAAKKAKKFPPNGGKFIVVDADKTAKDEERRIWIKEIDGTVRTPSWLERREIMSVNRRYGTEERFNIFMKKAWENPAKFDEEYANREDKPLPYAAFRSYIDLAKKMGNDMSEFDPVNSKRQQKKAKKAAAEAKS